MTELLEYSPDTPPIVIDEDGDIRDLSDFPEFEFTGKEEGLDYVVEDLPPGINYDKETSVLRYPQSLEENKHRIAKTDLARSAIFDRELTAQEELGGGISEIDEYDVRDLPGYRPLDAAIRGSKEWHAAVHDAVERFGMNELTLDDYEHMNGVDKATFSLRFKRFYELTGATKRRIDAVNGDLELDNRLRGLHGSGVRTQDELNEYSARLATLQTELDATGIPGAVTSYVNELRRSQTKRVRLNWGRINYRDYNIAFKVQPDGTKKPTRG